MMCDEPITNKMQELPPPFPGVGHSYESDFGDWCIRLDFLSERRARITSLTTGDSEVVNITIIQIRPNVFLVHWIESEGAVIAQIQDYDLYHVTTCTTLHRSTLCRQGTFCEVPTKDDTEE